MRTFARLAASAATAAAVIASVLTLSSPASAAAGPDGSSQARAAASCWEIKQRDAAAADGVYWLLTPQLQAPRKFYCDMTTDGGGWVLVGRGRDGWKMDYNGFGTSDQVAATVSGTGAFAPRQLDSRVIDALMGGRRIDSLGTDVRIRRARNAEGTQWQEVRLGFASRDRWSWSLAAGFKLTGATIDGTAVSGAQTTREFGSDTAFRRLYTYDDKKNNYVRGFTYGQGVVGSSSATSHLYSTAAGGAYATPFSQVFIRPKLRTADLSYSSIPDGGTNEQKLAPVPQSGSLPAGWGVTGTGAGGTGENATEVQAFAQSGNVMYVGGNFTTVRNASGSSTVDQPYLAAFDATTGDYLASFKPPRLNNQVKALAALPGGRLAVGGEFTTVGGQSRAGLVVLNGASGAVDTAWSPQIVNKLTGGVVSIRAMEASGDYLYLAGAMTHFRTGTSEVYAKGAGRIAISTRQPDRAWNPELNGTAAALDVSGDGSRVYLAGYFTTAKSANAQRAAVFGTASGAPRIAPSWVPTFSTSGSARYQQAIREAGSKVWLGGSQHSMFSYNASSFGLETATVTYNGGDFQSIDAGNGLVFGGCHCEHFAFSDTTNFDALYSGNPNPLWSQADRIYYIGAWDAGTGRYVPDFTPEMRSRGGNGVWSIKVADDGTVWAGGSLTSGVGANGRNQWLGGFARFAPRPTAVPAKPSGLTAQLDGDTAQVSWTGSSTSGVTHEVLRGDRVVATTTGTSVSVPDSASGDRFFVRAADERGNRSASTAAVRPSVKPVTTQLVPAGATWSYLVDAGTSPPAGWTSADDAPAGWNSGAAPLGWGTSGPIATNVDVAAGQTRPLASYFRRSFSVDDPATFSAVQLTTRADDGIAVYVNGTEVGRTRLPAGSLTPTTYATQAVSTANALADPVVYDVPRSLLRAGQNTIAVEVHSNYRATPNLSMDLALSAVS